MEPASKFLLLFSLAAMAGLSYYIGHYTPPNQAWIFAGLTLYLFMGLVCHHSAFNLYAAYNVHGSVWLELLLPHLVGAAVSMAAFTF